MIDKKLTKKISLIKNTQLYQLVKKVKLYNLTMKSFYRVYTFIFLDNIT